MGGQRSFMKFYLQVVRVCVCVCACVCVCVCLPSSPPLQDERLSTFIETSLANMELEYSQTPIDTA